MIFTNSMPEYGHPYEGYLASLARLCTLEFVHVSFWAILGQFMSKSGAAKAVAYKIIDTVGKDKAILILVLVTMVLTYGGVSIFVDYILGISDCTLPIQSGRCF